MYNSPSHRFHPALFWFAVGFAIVTMSLVGLMAGSRTDFLLGVVAVTLVYAVTSRLET